MRVFVTGATGFIGSAVVKELIDAGHQVLGLARSEASAQALVAAGAEVHRGSLEDLDSLRSGAAATDGIIHTAFIHDFSNYAANCEIDRKVITTLGEAIAGTGKPMVVTSGTALLAQGQLGKEADPVDPKAPPRVASEEAALAAAAKGANVSIMRLPPSVHGKGDHGFVPMLIGIAREKGVAAYVGEGLNRWPAVHRSDAAKAFRLALERSTPGAKFHAVDDQGVEVREITALIGRHLNIPVVSKSPEEAVAHFGWINHFIVLDVPTSSAQTRTLLDWQPTGPDLITDLDEGHYFGK